MRHGLIQKYEGDEEKYMLTSYVNTTVKYLIVLIKILGNIIGIKILWRVLWKNLRLKWVFYKKYNCNNKNKF